MSPHGRSEGRNYRSAQRGGCLMSPHGRSEGRNYRSAQRGGCLMSPHGRPKGEFPPGGTAQRAKGAS